MTLRAAAAIALAAALFLPGVIHPAAAEDMSRQPGQYLAIQLGAGNLSSSSHVGGSVNSKVKYDNGFAGTAAFGQAYGNGFRVEVELSRRTNGADSVDGTAASGSVRAHGLMLNGLYDFATGGPIIPYFGAGLGMVRVKSSVSPIGGSSVNDSDGAPAWQAIVGAAMPLGNGLELTADLRHFATLRDPSLLLASGTAVDAPYRDNSFMVGLRWRFGGPAPAPKPEPAAAPSPAPVAQATPAPAPAAQPRSFLIFFDWDKSAIRPDAQKILEAAAAAAKAGSQVSIQLTGHADRSGPTRYNQRLSERRANAAKAALQKLGLSAGSIATVGRGEAQPLVPTDDGVREPRNRRVEIQF